MTPHVQTSEAGAHRVWDGTILVANESTHARSSASPGAAAPGVHFQLEHARVEGKPRRRLPSPCRRKKALSTQCQLICWPLLPTFFGGLGTQPNKGRTSPWQMQTGQAGAVNISSSASAWTTLMFLCTRVPKLHVPAAELWKELVLDVHGALHLSPR